MMPAPLSLDLRERLVETVERGKLDQTGDASVFGESIGGGQDFMGMV